MRSAEIPSPFKIFSALMTRWIDSKRNTYFMAHGLIKRSASNKDWAISYIFYHMFPLHFIDILGLSQNLKAARHVFKTEQERTLLFLFGNLGDGSNGDFDVCFGVKNTQAKSDGPLWKSSNGAMSCRCTVKSWAAEDAEFLF